MGQSDRFQKPPAYTAIFKERADSSRITTSLPPPSRLSPAHVIQRPSLTKTRILKILEEERYPGTFRAHEFMRSLNIRTYVCDVVLGGCDFVCEVS